MISCYIVGDLCFTKNLEECIISHPLTFLCGISQDIQIDIDKIILLNPRILFVRASLINNEWKILAYLAKSCNVVYVSDNEGLAFLAYETGGFDYFLEPFGMDVLKSASINSSGFHCWRAHRKDQSKSKQISKSFFEM